MKRRFNHLMITMTTWLHHRYGYHVTKAYGIFPHDAKTTFKREFD